MIVRDEETGREEKLIVPTAVPQMKTLGQYKKYLKDLTSKSE